MRVPKLAHTGKSLPCWWLGRWDWKFLFTEQRRHWLPCGFERAESLGLLRELRDRVQLAHNDGLYLTKPYRRYG
jgi:hypothetical protein